MVSHASDAEEKMMEKYPVCGRGKLTPVNNMISEIEGHTFVEVDERRDSCGEEFIPEELR